MVSHDGYPPLTDVAHDQTTDAYAKVFFDRGHDDMLALLSPEFGIVGEDPSRQFVSVHQAALGADSAVDAALRLDTTVMLVDDPVKRVDTMTMAWGLEARVPFLDPTSSNSRQCARPTWNSPPAARACSKKRPGHFCPPMSSTAPRATSLYPASDT